MPDSAVCNMDDQCSLGGANVKQIWEWTWTSMKKYCLVRVLIAAHPALPCGVMVYEPHSLRKSLSFCESRCLL